MFTRLDLIGDDVRSVAPFAMTISGRDLFRGTQAGIGITVNAGSEVGFEIDAHTVQSVRARLAENYN